MTRSPLLRAILALALVAGAFVGLRQLPVAEWTATLTGPIRDLGVWGPVAFGAVYVAAALLLIPGSVLTLAAGGLFGVGLGTVVVSLASTATAALAFLIARHLARRRVQRRIAASPRLAVIDEAIGREGWKVVGLLRLTPLVPFTLLNYLCGVTAVRFWPYLLASWIAMLPGTLMYVYLGALGTDVVADRAASTGTWALRIIGLLATIAVTVYVSRLAQRAVRSRLEGEEPPSAGPPSS